MARYNPNPSDPQTAFFRRSNAADLQTEAAAYMAGLGAGRILSAITLSGGGAGSLFTLAIEHTAAADGVGISSAQASLSLRVFSGTGTAAIAQAYTQALASATASAPGIPLRDTELAGSAAAAIFFGFLVLALQQGDASFPGFGPVPPDVSDTAGAAGVAGTASRSDHTHFHGNLAGGALHAVATTLVAGFMSSADKAKLDGLATTWRDPVASYAALPVLGNAIGDVRITLSTLAAYVWNGSRWMPLGLQDLSVGHQSYEDFDQTTVAADLNWTATVAGAAAAVTNNAALVDANHFGIRELASGTTAAGRAGFYQSLNTRLLGGSRMFSEWLVQVNTLSNAGQRYLYRVGLGDFWSVATSSPVQGVFFEYDDSVSPNWLLVNQRAGARTVVNSGVAVAAGAWTKLALLVTDAPAQSEGFIAGTSVGVNVGLLPNQVVGYGQRILKSVGVASRSVYTDYFLQRTRFTTPR